MLFAICQRGFCLLSTEVFTKPYCFWSQQRITVLYKVGLIHSIFYICYIALKHVFSQVYCTVTFSPRSLDVMLICCSVFLWIIQEYLDICEAFHNNWPKAPRWHIIFNILSSYNTTRFLLCQNISGWKKGKQLVFTSASFWCKSITTD